MKPNKARLALVKDLNLCRGIGAINDKKVCVMQAVDYVTTGGTSDHPECACPVLTSFAIRLNDKLDDEMRQRLKPVIPKLIGTRDGAKDKRLEFLRHGVVTKILPLLMAEIGLTEEVKAIKKFKVGQNNEMYAFCTALRPKMRAAMAKRLGYKSYAYAYAYAADAAAAAAAYADAAAAADAADAADYADKQKWTDLRDRISKATISLLSKACDIKEKKMKKAA